VTQPILAVDGIAKSFRLPAEQQGAKRVLEVLRGVSFTVATGEIVSLIGESGSGKTTLLRIVQGLLSPNAGTVAVNGNLVRGPGYDRGIVFQQANLLPWLDARRNIEFGLELKRVPADERRTRSEELLQLIGLTSFSGHFPHQLSGGMQQRIGLARALAIDPDILLMDEPFSALDAQTREVLQRELLRIHAATRKTILFVTHDLDEALYLSDRIIVMGARPGRVKAVVDVTIARPRADVTELRGNPEFVRLREEIWSLIRPTEALA
jgi:NitT/TauT family transport system ATP-binding protein